MLLRKVPFNVVLNGVFYLTLYLISLIESRRPFLKRGFLAASTANASTVKALADMKYHKS